MIRPMAMYLVLILVLLNKRDAVLHKGIQCTDYGRVNCNCICFVLVHLVKKYTHFCNSAHIFIIVHIPFVIVIGGSRVL